MNRIVHLAAAAAATMAALAVSTPTASAGSGAAPPARVTANGPGHRTISHRSIRRPAQFVAGPRHVDVRASVHAVARRPAAPPNAFIHSSAATGPISPNPEVILVFWGSQWDSQDPSNELHVLADLYDSLWGSEDTWGTILDQYCEGGGISTGATTCPRGSTHVHHPTSTPLFDFFVDDGVPAPAEASWDEIAQEAVGVEQDYARGAAENQNIQYIIAFPSGTHPDGFNDPGFPDAVACGEHGSATDTVNGFDISLTNLPYVPDLQGQTPPNGSGPCSFNSDPPLYLNGLEWTATHEYAESVTDFIDGGWGLSDLTFQEIGDLCENATEGRLKLTASRSGVTRTYDMASLWSNRNRGCRT